MARSKSKKAAPAVVVQQDAEFEAFTMEEALADSGQTMEDLKVEDAPAKQPRPVGTSNLASTMASRRSGYAVALAPNGKKTQNAGDEVAKLLLLVPFPALVTFGVAFLGGQAYEHLNPGHARMCIGNKVRAAYRKGDAHVIEWLNSFVTNPEEETRFTESEEEAA
jgi:hypothetical protein